MKRLQVTLTEEGPNQHTIERSFTVDDEGITLDVGTAPQCELVLPRAAFLNVGRRQASIFLLGDEMVWIEGAGKHETRINLHLGSQRVLVGTHAFELKIEEISSASVGARGRRVFIAN